MKKLLLFWAGLCASVIAGGAYADIAALGDRIVAEQGEYFAGLTAGKDNAAEAVPVQADVSSVTEKFAKQYLPTGLAVSSGVEELAIGGGAAWMGRMRFGGPAGTSHLFASWITTNLKKPFCWAAEGYPAQAEARDGALADFLRSTVLKAQPGGKYTVKATGALPAAGTVVRGAFSKKSYGSPYDTAYVVFVDDRPLDNWGHPARLVFVNGDLSGFVVWYVSEPAEVSAGGVEVPFADLGGNVEVPQAPTLEETRAAIEAFNAKTLGDETNIYYDGTQSRTYAVLISGGYNIYNNHTRYWGDVAAMYSTLTKKYSIPKSNIRVCVSDGASSAADVSSDYYSYSHSQFSGNSSPLDLDGDGSADVAYSATRYDIGQAFSSLPTLTADDQLFVFVTDHGDQTDDGSCYVCLWDNDLMSVSDFASLTRNLACPVAFALEFCYSGGFINALKSQGGVRAVATAASVETSSAWSWTSSVTGIGYSTGIYYMNPWVYYFVGAARGRFPEVSVTPWNDSTTSCPADTSGDGYVSIKEASDYAKSKILADGYDETPNYGESSSGVGSSLFFVKRDDSPIPGPVDPYGLDTSLTFTAGGDASWFKQTSATHDGVDAAQSGSIGNYGTTWLETTVNGPCDISFWWKVSSESGYDYLRFYIDDVEQSGSISGEVDWTKMAYALSTGSHRLKWVYTKDGSQLGGSDCGWVDQLQVQSQSRIWTVKYHKNTNSGVDITRSQNFYLGLSQRLLYLDSGLKWSLKDGDGFSYTFLGWAKSPKGAPVYSNGEEVVDLAEPGKVLHLYAVWQKYAYNVCFHSNDGRNLSEKQEFRPGIAKNLLWLDGGLGWTRSGYDFLGWAKAPTGGIVYSNGEVVQDLASQGETLHLYAVWRERKWTVRLHKNDGTGRGDTTQDCNFNVGAWGRLPWTDSGLGWTRPDFKFKGWARSPTGAVVYGNGEVVKDLVGAGETLHLYAKWESKYATYTVRYHKNDGTTEVANQTFKVGEKKSLCWTESVLGWTVGVAGYRCTFLGWAKSPTGAIIYSNGQPVADLAASGATLHLYAVWRVNFVDNSIRNSLKAGKLLCDSVAEANLRVRGTIRAMTTDDGGQIVFDGSGTLLMVVDPDGTEHGVEGRFVILDELLRR